MASKGDKENSIWFCYLSLYGHLLIYRFCIEQRRVPQSQHTRPSDTSAGKFKEDSIWKRQLADLLQESHHNIIGVINAITIVPMIKK